MVPVANLNGNKKKTNALLNMSVEGHKFTSFCNYSVLPSLNKLLLLLLILLLLLLLLNFPFYTFKLFTIVNSFLSWTYI